MLSLLESFRSTRGSYLGQTLVDDQWPMTDSKWRTNVSHKGSTSTALRKQWVGMVSRFPFVQPTTSMIPSSLRVSSLSLTMTNISSERDTDLRLSSPPSARKPMSTKLQSNNNTSQRGSARSLLHCSRSTMMTFAFSSLVLMRLVAHQRRIRTFPMPLSARLIGMTICFL